MVAWPEGIHHVLALPQDQQSVRQDGQGQNKQSSEHANSTVLQTQDGQISNLDDTKGGEQVEEHFKNRLLTARNRLKLFHQVEFWECFTHPAYTDLDLIMQDGRLPVNRLIFQFSKFSLFFFAPRASLVALSPNLSTLLDPSIDALILENVCHQVEVA